MAGRKHRLRIHGHTVQSHLEVEVYAEAMAGIPGHAQNCAALHPLTRSHLRGLAQVAIDRSEPVAVVKEDEEAVPTAGVAAGHDDTAVSRGQDQPHRLVRRDIDAERVLVAERARQIPVQRPREPQRRRRYRGNNAR
jgi:hypothetical protein